MGFDLKWNNGGGAVGQVLFERFGLHSRFRFTWTSVDVGVVQDVGRQETMVRSVGSLPVAQDSNPRCSESAGQDHALQ